MHVLAKLIHKLNRGNKYIAQKCGLLLQNNKKTTQSKKITRWAKILRIWDRGYDFLNIFAKKFSEKIGVFDSK
jgi:hypothetical protein